MVDYTYENGYNGGFAYSGGWLTLKINHFGYSDKPNHKYGPNVLPCIFLARIIWNCRSPKKMVVT